MTLRQEVIREELTVGKKKSGYVDVRRHTVIVQQEGRRRHMLHPLGKAAKSPAEVLPSQICSLENDTFAESR